MITLSKMSLDEKVYLTGTIGKTGYTVLHKKKVERKLKKYMNNIEDCDTYAEVEKILEKAQKYIDKVEKTEDTKTLEEILPDDLYKDNKTGEYFIKYKNSLCDVPVHKFFVDKMKLACDMELDPKPWIIFWVRLMRNDLYVKDTAKVNNLVEYMSTPYIDRDKVKDLEEKGYSSKKAEELSTFDQVSITEQGILNTFKYVQLVDKEYVVNVDEETGEQVVEKVDKYKTTKTVDKLTGVITETTEKPEFIESYEFLPPVMGGTGDPLLRHEVGEVLEEDSEPDYIIKVGQVHKLPKGFSQVNTDDSRSCVKGLHVGGYNYVSSYGGKTNYLLDCLVSPEDIGAVTDPNRSSDKAIRCRRYYAIGGHFAVNRGMYHPSKYAIMLDKEWVEVKKEVINKLKESIEKEEERL